MLIKGEEIDLGTAEKQYGNGWVSYKAKGASENQDTLTLHNVTIEYTSKEAVINASGNLKIVLEGKNSITNNHYSTNEITREAVTGRGLLVGGMLHDDGDSYRNISFAGDGSLSVTTTGTPIEIVCDAKIEGCSLDLNSQYRYGLNSKSLTIENGAKIESSSSTIDGCWIQGDLTVKHSSFSAYSESEYAYFCQGDLKIENSSFTVLSNKSNGVYLQEGDVSITRSELSIEGELIGLWTNSNVNSLELNGVTGSITGKTSFGIYAASGDVSIGDNSDLSISAGYDHGVCD